MKSGELAAIWEQTQEDFAEESRPFIHGYLCDREITWIDADQVMQITEEDIGSFLSRDPVNGYWHPDKWAKEVFQNFLDNETYYFDKVVRGRGDQ